MRLLTKCLGVFLVFQLVMIDAGFIVPEISYGSIVEIALINEKKVTQQRPTTKLTAVSEHYDSLIVVGDVLLARNVEFLLNTKGYDHPYKGIIFNKIGVHPAVVGNFEAAVPLVHRPTKAGQINFSVKPEYLSSLRRAGFTHFSLANNHSFDFGESGFINTMRELHKSDLVSFGKPHTLIKESVSFILVADTKVALIGLHTLVKTPTEDELERVLGFASKKSDFQIIYVHWGVEYDLKNSNKQRHLAELLVGAGADLIVGHHPHVVQNIDLIAGVPVFYSLGNYIFDQYFSPTVQEGLLLQLTFSKSLAVSLLPVTSVGNLSQPNYMNNISHKLFLSNLAKKSHPKLQAEITKGTIFLNSTVATSAKIAMMVK